MYDDHRKKGITVMSEKEFRGYYALLKLDKHPGYKVEPAELSLDLAKMTPQIRQTPEILFARDVARACRTGNFIAFFRLARKATYLQACLMHAHFAKLRTQALASLHSGLQSNQGIPISQITKWLGMEEEDIEGLLEYHGFLIKDFKELYMVKEGPFLNSDKDYPTMCSRLVHSKKSISIVKDISSSNQLMVPAEESIQIMSGKIVEPPFKAPQLVQSRPSVDTVDEVMVTFKEEPSPTDGSHVHPILEKPVASKRIRSEPQIAEVASVWAFPSPKQPPQSAAAKVAKVCKPAREILQSESLERTLCFNVEGVPHNFVTERSQQSDRSEGSSFESWVANPAPQIVMGPQENDETLTCHLEFKDEEAIVPHQELEDEEQMLMAHQDREVAEAKLKLILRKWKRVSSKRKELREQRQLAANAALSSLTLGPPIQQIRAPSSHVRGLDIDRALRERRERHQKSWSRLNVSEVVGGILGERNPDAKCLCWKLIVCSQPSVTEGERFVKRGQTNQSASLWLHSKIMGVRKDNDDELAVSSLDLSIWKKWATRQYDSSSICCLSLIREARFNMLESTVGGAGAILFLVSESIPLDVQKVQLHKLIMSLPSGSCIPALILCGSHKEGSLNSLTIVNGLGLHEVDKTRMSSFSVVFLVEDQPHEICNGFFSTERLRNGLQWLASQSPVQPVVHCIKAHDLIVEQLSSLLGALKNTNASVGPNQCISAFNEALDRSAAEVATAAETNPSSWPCHEITLLETSNERGVVESFLPSVGWSSAATVKPMLSRIQACKLPYFSDDMSWLNNGSDMGEEILHHKSELERCLIRYLTDTSKMMDKALAATEACVIVQKGALLELQGSNYCIKPKWGAIFRRIFNWRLMSFTSGKDFVAYVLEHRSNIATPPMCGIEVFNNGAASALHSWDEIELEAYGSLPDSLSQPSLDEMVGVCYNTRQFGRERSKPEAIQPLSRTNNLEKEALHAATANLNREDNESLQQEVEFTKADGTYFSDDFSGRVGSDYYQSRELVLASNGRKETDNLSKLLEQCNIMQNKIDEKLSIYF
ncbi:Sac3 family protein b [Thalictrum thalictroides]|uniref:Sac3 family protein b n=1 Tax=Thalictrum thalictroides TaxID=46969 RepID=A0A7J6V639_THATH|nr:Sac3 family protein b [Thalictrum thalictroides]